MPNTTYYTDIYYSIIKKGMLSAGILAQTYYMTPHNVTNILRDIYNTNPEVIYYEPALHKHPFFLLDTPEAKQLFKQKLCKEWLAVSDLAELHQVSLGTARSILYILEKSNPAIVKRAPYKGGFIILLQNTPKALSAFKKLVMPIKGQWITAADLSIKYKLRLHQANELLKSFKKIAPSNVYSYKCKVMGVKYLLKNTPEAVEMFENMFLSHDRVSATELIKKYNVSHHRVYDIFKKIIEQYPDSIKKQKNNEKIVTMCMDKKYIPLFEKILQQTSILSDEYLCKMYNFDRVTLDNVKQTLQSSYPEIFCVINGNYNLIDNAKCIAKFENYVSTHIQQNTDSDWRTVNMLCVKYGLRQEKVKLLLKQLQTSIPESLQKRINKYGYKELYFNGKYISHFEQLLKKPTLSVTQLADRYNLSYCCIQDKLIKLRTIMPTEIQCVLKKEGGKNMEINVINTPEVLEKLDQCFKHRNVKRMLNAARMVCAQNVR